MTIGPVSGRLQSVADLIRSGVIRYIFGHVSLALQVYILPSGPLAKQIPLPSTKLFVLVQTVVFKLAMPDAGYEAVLPLTQSGDQASKFDSRRQGGFGGRVSTVHSAY